MARKDIFANTIANRKADDLGNNQPSDRRMRGSPTIRMAIAIVQDTYERSKNDAEAQSRDDVENGSKL